MLIGFVELFVLLGIIFGFVLVAVLVLGFMKGSPAVRWLLASLLLLPLAAVLVLFTLRMSFKVPAPRPTEVAEVIALVNTGRCPTAAVEIIEQVGPELSASPIWNTALEQELIPEKYSSPQSAAYSLGMQLKETITEAGITDPKEIIISKQNELSTELLNELRNGLKSQYEEAEIFFKSRISGALEGQVVLNVEIEQQRLGRTWRNEKKVNSTYDVNSQVGTLEAGVTTAKGSLYRTVSFDYRPWLWDFNQFQSAVSGFHHWMIAVSEETATDSAQAREQALDDAVAQLNQVVKIPRHGHITKQDLSSHGLIVDEYSQKFQGMAGPIFRHAILLDVQSGRLKKLIGEVVHEEKVKRQTWVRTIFSLAGMILLVTVIYVFLNIATKGYYSTMLAVLAVAVLVIGGIILMKFMGMGSLSGGF